MYIPNIFYLACLHLHCQQLQQLHADYVFGHDLVDAWKYNLKTVLTFKEKTSTCNNYHILN